MTREQIIEIISQLDTEKTKVIRVNCRPREKSNKVLVTEVDGHQWYCERPTYFWSKFDLNFIQGPYYKEPELLFPEIKEPLIIFDNRGLCWLRYEMSSFGLLEYYLKNPLVYVEAMARHHEDLLILLDGLKNIEPLLEQEKFFKDNLKKFVELYALFYKYESSIFMLFDELVMQFRNLLRQFLDKGVVNAYFGNFLSGEMTKEALRLGFVEERGALELSTTRGVLYGMDIPPRIFYKDPKFYFNYEQDLDILSALIKKGISSYDLRKFLAFRIIVPIGFQINEESQYFETSLLSAHLGVLAKQVAKKLNKTIPELQKLNLEEIFNLI